MNRIGFVLIVILFAILDLQAQIDFGQVEQQILDTYRILKKANLEQNPERQQIFSEKLKSQLMYVLLQEGSYYYPFLRLKQLIKIVESPDKRIRVFSWDAFCLGNGRTVCSIAQFRGARNESYFHVLSDGKERERDYKDVFIQEIYLLDTPSNDLYYIFLGKGSHGVGQEHTTLRIFSLEHNQLLECAHCFDSKTSYWSVEGSTQYPVELTYNARRKQIHYYQPTFNFKTGAREKGLHHQLFWKNGAFRSY